MRHWDLAITEKKPKDLQVGEAGPEYSDGKYTGFRVGRDKHGWFAFRGRARTVSRREAGLLTSRMLGDLRALRRIEDSRGARE